MNRKNPSPLESHLGYWIRCLSNLVHESFARRIEKNGITVAQWVVLRTLYDNPKLSLNEAAGLVGVDKSTLSRVIDRLIKRGFVIRESGNDRRSISLSITASGSAIVPILARLADDNDEEFFHSLSVKKRAELKKLIMNLLKENGWELSERGKDRMA